MAYRVRLVYFRPTGRFLTYADCNLVGDALTPITKLWDEIHELRRVGRLPGLRPNAGRDLFIVVDVVDHPQRIPHLVMPPFVDEEDITPPRIPTEEMVPLVRVPLEEMPRTTTRDVVKVDVDADTDVLEAEEITPVDTPIPKPTPTQDQ